MSKCRETHTLYITVHDIMLHVSHMSHVKCYVVCHICITHVHTSLFCVYIYIPIYIIYLCIYIYITGSALDKDVTHAITPHNRATTPTRGSESTSQVEPGSPTQTHQQQHEDAHEVFVSLEEISHARF